MKEEYEKPQITVNWQVEGVFPAAVVAAFPALAGGVVLGKQIKKTLSDGRSLYPFNALQVWNDAEVSA